SYYLEALFDQLQKRTIHTGFYTKPHSAYEALFEALTDKREVIELRNYKAPHYRIKGQAVTDLGVSYELDERSKNSKAKTSLDFLSPDQTRVLGWLQDNKQEIIAAEAKFGIDRRAIAGAIAWEALENVRASWTPSSVGLGKVHLITNPLYSVVPGESGTNTVAKQVEDAGYLPKKSYDDRKKALGTVSGGITYIAAILKAGADIAYSTAGYDIYKNPPILTFFYQSADLKDWKTRMKAKKPGDPLYPGDSMGRWVEVHLRFLQEGVGDPSFTPSYPSAKAKAPAKRSLTPAASDDTAEERQAEATGAAVLDGAPAQPVFPGKAPRSARSPAIQRKPDDKGKNDKPHPFVPWGLGPSRKALLKAAQTAAEGKVGWIQRMGAAGEASASLILKSLGTAVKDLNDFTPKSHNFPTLDLITSKGAQSVKVKATHTAFTADTAKSYISDLKKVLSADSLKKAAEGIAKHRQAIIESGAWPKGLPHDASPTAIAEFLAERSQLAIPSDHVGPVKAALRADIKAFPENYPSMKGLKPNTSAYSRAMEAIVGRVKSIGITSTEIDRIIKPLVAAGPESKPKEKPVKKPKEKAPKKPKEKAPKKKPKVEEEASGETPKKTKRAPRKPKKAQSEPAQEAPHQEAAPEVQGPPAPKEVPAAIPSDMPPSVSALEHSGQPVEEVVEQATREVLRRQQILGRVKGIFRYGGKILIVVAAANDLYQIYEAEDRVKAIITTAAGWEGASIAGAAFAAWFAPADGAGPWAWAAHGVGTLAAGGVGYWVGSSTTRYIYEIFIPAPPITVPLK
ncbi:MAG TPA: hypothetical protein VG820_03820, partial [Fimbriimonadaceae bacterium]|nr:hypothetical protein [Fimbriimonadaceae bacterium]